MADTINSFARKWARVKARVEGGWDREFVRTIDIGLQREGWAPTTRQRDKIESLFRVYGADTPEIREEFVRKDGSKIVYYGLNLGWLEVLE